MNTWHIILLAAGYFALLLLLSRLVGGTKDNEAFFRGNRRSPWWAVAFGMIGASVSGVTFVSVPGMVQGVQMTYLQMCFGFVVGYVLVAFVLLPIYYKLNLITIYTYLNERFGLSAYRTGAVFFFFSKLIGACIRLFLVCLILQRFFFDVYGLPFWLNVSVLLLLIWLYTRSSGIKTIVWSDCLQTLVLLSALVAIMWQLCSQMDLTLGAAVQPISESEMSKAFVFDDPKSKQYFWKLFVSGIFTVVVMTGLDQDMMQKNLTCRTLKQSQLNMCVNGFLYLPVNLVFLCLGALMLLYCQQKNIALPAASDEILPFLCGSGQLGQVVMACFTLGIVAAAFSSADSAMTSLTTCCCVDILRCPLDEKVRKIVHPLVGVAFLIFILLVKALNSTSVIDAVYTVCSYTYGPLLGLFSFGLLTKFMPRPKWVPVICVASPFICYALREVTFRLTGYSFGYELLLCNGLITFLGLLASSSKFCAKDARGNGHV